MKYKAVLFDLDGTLLDTLEDIADSMNYVLSSFNMPTHEINAYKYFVGNGMDQLVYKSFPENCRNEALLVQGYEAMRVEYDKRCYDKTAPYKGIPEMLDELTAKGMKLTVLSNKPDHFTKTMTARLLGKWQFHPVLGVRPPIPKKPDPAGAFEILNELEIEPQEFLYLGDTGVDMITAKKAGMYAVGVLWGFRDADELNSNGAKVLIKEPADLIKLL